MPRGRSTPPCRRYRRVAVTYTVAREHGPATWPTLSSPEEAAEFARELLAHDDDREHLGDFPQRQNGYTGHHLVPQQPRQRSSTPARCWGRPSRGRRTSAPGPQPPVGDTTPSKEGEPTRS
jgi:hypothetical protein